MQELFIEAPEAAHWVEVRAGRFGYVLVAVEVIGYTPSKGRALAQAALTPARFQPQVIENWQPGDEFDIQSEAEA